MIDFTIETEIDRPPATVFAYISDPEKLPTWQTNTVSVEQLDDGPLDLGTRLREVHRGPRGKEIPSLVEVSEFEPNRVFALHTVEGPLSIDGWISLEPSGEKTRMAFRVHGQPGGAMRLAQPVLRIALGRQFKQHCATLKRVLEER
jgi:uncharacterized protein YndB with AHSA1/START domain